jgi:bacterioferritin-associated ferredoxin
VLVCICHPANDRDIDECIREGARTVEDVGAMCGAGTGCGACRDELRERLERAGAGDEADRPRLECVGGPVQLRIRAR